jgi:hypothetical protein
VVGWVRSVCCFCRCWLTAVSPRLCGRFAARAAGAGPAVGGRRRISCWRCWVSGGAACTHRWPRRRHRFSHRPHPCHVGACAGCGAGDGGTLLLFGAKPGLLLSLNGWESLASPALAMVSRSRQLLTCCSGGRIAVLQRPLHLGRYSQPRTAATAGAEAFRDCPERIGLQSGRSGLKPIPTLELRP